LPFVIKVPLEEQNFADRNFRGLVEYQNMSTLQKSNWKGCKISRRGSKTVRPRKFPSAKLHPGAMPRTKPRVKIICF